MSLTLEICLCCYIGIYVHAFLDHLYIKGGAGVLSSNLFLTVQIYARFTFLSFVTNGTISPSLNAYRLGCLSITPRRPEGRGQ